MRYLVVGAGALGGYFGGRLLEAGRDLTFLLRPGRAEALARTGLVIRSRFGDATLSAPPFVLKENLHPSFDVVVVACKAYDLEATMDAFAPAVGPQTAILPLLNGLGHFDALQQRFGAERVLGGLCMISAALDAAGTVQHFNDFHVLVFGELDGSASARVAEMTADFAGAKFEARASSQMLLELWEKWVFIASAAAITCLMRASIGDIVAAGAVDLSEQLLEECRAIAAASGFAPRPASIERYRAILTAAGSLISASMLKDIERGAPIEADHVIGDLLRRAPAAGDAQPPSLLRIAHAHLKAYEARRASST
ncbi:MAG: 2-dehydropantoate 2-reductase [Caldimonas sp.]